ncbi:MAG: ATP-dependent Clp protease ATP-binding subunit [Parasporobacterium sp.]|nr:ATP-dependent Clp protease ATP-binding subunit [Parasporobacterium sp.]
MKKPFTNPAAEVMTAACETAQSLGQTYIGTEHILAGLADVEGCTAQKILADNGITIEGIMKVLKRTFEHSSPVAVAEGVSFSPAAEELLNNAGTEADKNRSSKVGTEHILLAMLRMTDCGAARIVSAMGGNRQKILTDLFTAMGEDLKNHKDELGNDQGGGQQPAKKEEGILRNFSRDLCEAVKEGKIDPVIGREQEIERLIQILSRRTKNNPCLVGEPGVGKTAIAEALAQKIAAGEITGPVADKRILSLDLPAMVAGSKYRGEFEERVKRVIREVSEDGHIILFMDEIHTMIGAGGAEGSIDAANILKPALARGEVQIIGATTADEYRKHFEKDAALVRRFQPVYVEQPGQEETVSILKGLRHKYEEHHNVKITDGAIVAAAQMSARYINDRFLPDKAIDVLDEAASAVKLSSYILPPKISKLEEELKYARKKLEDYIMAGNLDAASEFRHETESLKASIKTLQDKAAAAQVKNILKVTEDDIADVVSKWTRIPVRKLARKESEKLKTLEKELHKRVVAQDEAVTALSKAIRRGRTGLKDPKKPIGSFLFLGPTGVGKTELSKALADALFGTENAIIRVDMSEYMEKHSVSRLIGSPPGYVGYEEGGQLAEQVRRNPYSIVLFDEIEKAHPDVFNVLLQILDDGRVTDSHGRYVDFKNTIIIMTSNAGASRIQEPKNLGFAAEKSAEADYKMMKEAVMNEVRHTFRPEFINRIDEIIVFASLTKENMKGIADIILNEIAKRAESQLSIKLKVTDGAKTYLVDQGFDKRYGARSLKRKIQSAFEDEMAEQILDGRIKAGDRVTVTVKDNKLVFRPAKRD